MSGRYPEHEKMMKVKEESQAIGDFIDWLSWHKRVHLAKWENDRFSPFHYDIERLIAEYYGIDLNVIETEKRAMIEEFRGMIDRE